MNFFSAIKDKAYYLYNDIQESAKPECKDLESRTENVPTLDKVSQILKTTISQGKQLIKTNLDDLFEDDFFKEQQKNAAQVGNINIWADSTKPDLLKKQILALSNDSRNFLRNPPDGSDFLFKMEENAAHALFLLKEDPKLSKMRFKLVPLKINEEQFWRNYFYRISLIKQSINLYDEQADQVDDPNVNESLSKTTSFIDINSDSEKNINDEISKNDDEDIEKLLELKDYEMVKSQTSDEWDQELQDMLDNQNVA